MKTPFAHYRPEDNCYQSVSDHLVGTSTYAASFANKVGMMSAGLLAGLCHDIGKYSGAFQNYISTAITKRMHVLIKKLTIHLQELSL